MVTVKIGPYSVYNDCLRHFIIRSKKVIINTINAHSYMVAKKDKEFEKALINSDILLPDGEGIIFMANVIQGQKIQKIAGADIHQHLLHLAHSGKLKCFYLGASQSTLDLIKEKQEKAFPNIKFGFFSPPFREIFSENENLEIIEEVNHFAPDILFVGMTAPKQEKWVYQNKGCINAKVICSIGAVFDFVAETKKRAPNWVIAIKMEWLYRSFTAWRLTKRYAYSTPLFLFEVLKLKLTKTIN